MTPPTPHPVKRLQERYQTRNGWLELRALEKAMADGRCKFLEPARDGRTTWEAYVRGKRIRFVWDEASNIVVTVLPRKQRPPRTERYE
jgi:hypothetical protein